MKKPSDAKSNEKQHDPFALLLDENLSSKSIIQGLLGHNIPVHPQTYVAPRGVTDDDLLLALAEHDNLYLLSRDQDFRYHSATQKRLMDSGIGAFVITSSGNKNSQEIIALITKAWRRIQKFISKTKRPFVAKVTSEGKVQAHK